MSSDDFFRSRLEQMIDLRHPLAVLAKRMPWAQIEAALAPVFAHKSRPGKVIEEENLFGTSLEIAAADPSAAGRPRLPIRLMASLLYLDGLSICFGVSGHCTAVWIAMSLRASLLAKMAWIAVYQRS